MTYINVRKQMIHTNKEDVVSLTLKSPITKSNKFFIKSPLSTNEYFYKENYPCYLDNHIIYK